MCHTVPCWRHPVHGSTLSARACPGPTTAGEWCVRQGNYTLEDPGDISSLPGSPCQQIEKISCIKWV